MIIYVSCSKNGAPEITERLQMNDMDNCYLCPQIVFSHLQADRKKLLLLYDDLMTCCDKVIVISGHGTDMLRHELRLAKTLGMEVETINAESAGV